MRDNKIQNKLEIAIVNREKERKESLMDVIFKQIKLKTAITKMQKKRLYKLVLLVCKMNNTKQKLVQIENH